MTARRPTRVALGPPSSPAGGDADPAGGGDGPEAGRGRPRTMSEDAEGGSQPGGVSVGDMVAKAKKAAVSLWLILHAQTCRDDDCPVRGCAETKRLLVHVRSCPSSGGCCPCPSGVKGCSETRKLLAHYRRCKDARTRSVGSGAGRGRAGAGGAGAGENCLVCTLMARYARNQLDRMQSSSSPGTCVRVPHGGGRRLNGSAGGCDGLALLSSSIDGGTARYSVEPGLVGGERRPPGASLRRQTSSSLMPPPPPRTVPGVGDPPAGGAVPIGSPPGPLDLMSSKMAMLAQVASMDPEYDLSSSSAAAAAPPAGMARSADAPSAFGGARGVTPEDDTMRDDGDDDDDARGSGLRRPPPRSSPARKRSTSYDGRESRVTFCRDVVQTTFYPTERAIREEPLDSGPRGGGRAVDLPPAARDADASPARPRSASCGNMSASSGSSVCSREEPLDVGAPPGQEEIMFQMD